MIEAEGEGLGGGSPGRAGLAGVCAGREISPQNSRSWMEVEVPSTYATVPIDSNSTAFERTATVAVCHLTID